MWPNPGHAVLEPVCHLSYSLLVRAPVGAMGNPKQPQMDPHYWQEPRLLLSVSRLS